jgi:hypothetical protein
MVDEIIDLVTSIFDKVLAVVHEIGEPIELLELVGR